MKTETTSQYEQQAEAFLKRFGINFRATLKDSKPAPWKDDENIASGSGHHYRVTLSKRGHGRSFDNQPKRLTFDFWGSVADFKAGRTAISAYDVLACISGDVNCPETFKDFCDDYGYDKDSIKALQSFRRCASFGKRLREFFTAKEVEALQEIR